MWTRITVTLLLAASAWAGDIEDLGVLTPHKGIILEKCTNRADFFQFKVELVAQRWPSNQVEFTTTNSLLTLENFMAMPPGPCIMGVREITSDGDESSVSLFRVDVRRDPAKAPRAHTVHIATSTNVVYRQSIENLLKSRLHTNRQSIVLPPMPPVTAPMRTNTASDLSRETVRAMAEESMNGLTNLTPIVTFTGPLPGGSPKTYSDHMVEMHDFYTRRRR